MKSAFVLAGRNYFRSFIKQAIAFFFQNSNFFHIRDLSEINRGEGGWKY